MNNLRLFTNEKRIDQQSTIKLRTVLLKISSQKMEICMFKFCQYVFESYNASQDKLDTTPEDFSHREERVLEMNAKSQVFDQDILAHVLKHFKGYHSGSIKAKSYADILKLAKALFAHSKKLEHKNKSEQKISLQCFQNFII